MELDINELLNFSPLMKTFTFNAWVVAGFTPITRGSTLDYYINRPQGMKGYIINLTLRGQARAKAGDAGWGGHRAGWRSARNHKRRLGRC